MRRALLAFVVSAFGVEEASAQTLLWTYGKKIPDLDRMGDFDGDGIPDVVVVRGATSVVPIVLSGKDGSEITRFAETGGAGARVAGIGDCDGDGVPDLLFGDPGFLNSHGENVGRAAAVSGATGAEFFIEQGGRGANGADISCGICVRGMGDANGDGRPDFGIGTWSIAVFLGLGPSAVSVVFGGGAGGAGSLLPWRFDDGYLSPSHMLAPIGDIDGDGGTDFAVSYQDQSSKIDIVEVHSGATAALLYTISGSTVGEKFGVSLGSCGDVDGDGIREILIGAPGRWSNNMPTGAVFVCSGASGSVLYELDGDTGSQQFGVEMDAFDDVDGDGVSDFVVASDGTGGRVQIFSAATGRELDRVSSMGANRVRDVGDLDGDGHDDVAFTSGNSVEARAVLPFLELDAVAPARIRWDHVGTLALTGTGFTADPNLTVQIDGVPATNVNVTGYTDLTCTPPALDPGPHDVTVTNRYGSSTLAGGLLLTPALFVDGVPAIGSTVDLRYEFEALDSTFAIAGAPPLLSIPTPPFGGALAISPFLPLFVLNAWPTDEFVSTQTIPNNPALIGTTVLLQSLTGPTLYGPGREGAWTNVVAMTIQ
jgi:hypothetical protein